MFSIFVGILAYLYLKSELRNVVLLQAPEPHILPARAAGLPPATHAAPAAAPHDPDGAADGATAHEPAAHESANAPEPDAVVSGSGDWSDVPAFNSLQVG